MTQRINRTKLILILLSVVLAAGCLLAGCSGTAGSGSGLIISEVVSSNTNSLSVGSLGSPDWVEVYNSSKEDISLNGYVLRNTANASAYYTFPDRVLKAGEYLVVYACEVSTPVEELPLCTGFKLSKDGVGLVLMNANFVVQDEVEVPALESDISWSRTEKGFRYCMTPTPGRANGGITAETLEELHAIQMPEGVCMNEATRDWVEIYNGSQEAVLLSQYCLSDNAANLDKWRLPEHELKPGEYFVIGLKQQIGDAVADFGISSMEDSIYFSFESKAIGVFKLGDLPDNLSIGLDGSGNTLYFTEMTPGAANAANGFGSLEPVEMTAQDPVQITEVLLENAYSIIDEHGDRPAWVELHNSSAQSVNLANYALSDDETNLGKWRLPEQELAAGGYIVIYCSGRDAGLHANFKVASTEPVILTDLTTMHSQKINIPAENRSQDVAYGVQDGKWLYFGRPTPGMPNTAHGNEGIVGVEKINRLGVWINEVNAAAAPRNSTLGLEGRDWVELYNGGDAAVNLNGWYLGKDLDDPYRCTLSGTIEAHSYKVIYLSSSVDSPSGTLPMGLSLSGEEMVLSNAAGYIVDVFQTGALRYKLSSGRAQADYSGDRYFFTTPTPGYANATPVSTYSQAPVFSKVGGWYTDSFQLEISGSDSIYYTLDGSMPDASSAKYTGPLTISSTTVVKAVSIETGKVPSNDTVATYFFTQPHTVPVVSISMPSEDFSYIYAQTDKFAAPRERECYVEYYEPDGRIGTAFPAGVRVTGGGTRVMSQRSLNLYLRAGYGQSSVVYPFFKDYEITEFQSLTLRNGGQDNMNSSATFMADAYCSMLGKGFEADYAETRYAVLYVNGKYWGVYELKENQNEDFFAARHGAEAETVNSIRRNQKVLQGSNAQFLSAQAYAQSYNIASTANYEKLCQWVDIDAFIDHIFLEGYTGNVDTFNQKYWTTRDYSVKIRPVWYDLDLSGFNANVIWHYFSDGIPSGDGSLTYFHIHKGLKQNESWRERLYERWAYHLTHTLEDRMELFDAMYAELEPEMQRHCQRWGIYSYSTWKNNVAALRRKVENRNSVFKSQMQSYFGLSDAKMAELFSQG